MKWFICFLAIVSFSSFAQYQNPEQECQAVFVRRIDGELNPARLNFCRSANMETVSCMHSYLDQYGSAGGQYFNQCPTRQARNPETACQDIFLRRIDGELNPTRLNFCRSATFETVNCMNDFLNRYGSAGGQYFNQCPARQSNNPQIACQNVFIRRIDGELNPARINFCQYASHQTVSCMNSYVDRYGTQGGQYFQYCR